MTVIKNSSTLKFREFNASVKLVSLTTLINNFMLSACQKTFPSLKWTLEVYWK